MVVAERHLEVHTFAGLRDGDETLAISRDGALNLPVQGCILDDDAHAALQTHIGGLQQHGLRAGLQRPLAELLGDLCPTVDGAHLAHLDQRHPIVGLAEVGRSGRVERKLRAGRKAVHFASAKLHATAGGVHLEHEHGVDWRDQRAAENRRLPSPCNMGVCCSNWPCTLARMRSCTIL